jgi:hypothetical protein
MKVCSNCGKTKELDEFSNHKKAKDGKQTYCKECASTKHAEWKRNNKEKVSVYNAEWKRNNREKVNAASAKWRRNNREKANTRVAEWRAKAQPCVYRIKHKASGSYYIGQTTKHFSERLAKHFNPKSNLTSPFTGLNKDEWECEVLCYGTKQEVKDLEKALLNTRVGKDPLCMNKYT